MSEPMNDPPPIPAVPLAYYAQPFVRRRPVLLSVIAWVAIVFGGLGSLGILTSGVMLVVAHYTGLFGVSTGQSASGGTPNFFDYIAIINLISGIAAIPLLIGGIKTLGLKPTGRKLLIGYGIYSLVFSVVSAVVTYKVITPMTGNLVMQQTMTVNGAATTTSVKIGAPPNYSSVLIQQIIGVVVNYAIVGAILYYLMRPEIKLLFEQTPPEGLTDTNQRTES